MMNCDRPHSRFSLVNESERRRLSMVRPFFVILFVFAVTVSSSTAGAASGASLRVSPSTGNYEVGALIDVSFLLDTGGESVNAVQADINFSPDKLQVVNPAASTSFISIWVSAPTYSNTDGTIHFQGGVPNPGIKTSAGVISTVTFRVKAPGKAMIGYAATSKVLRNDGEGTNILTSTTAADFTLKLPPPAGPIVSSSTHPNVDAWYNNLNVQLQWEAADNAVGYSYIFDQTAKTVPDEIVETIGTTANQKATTDGTWYFHLRAKTLTWGGVTTFPIQIDSTPPATFQPQLDKDFLTTKDIGTLRWLTTDSASGIDHFEVKQVQTSPASSRANTLFVEASSPYTFGPLDAGEFDFTVRAVDRAGNIADASTKLKVYAGGLPFLARVPLLSNPAVANGAVIGLGALVLLSGGFFAIRRFRPRATFRHDLAALEKDARKKAKSLQRELDELRAAELLVKHDLDSGAPRTILPPASRPPTGIV